MRGVQLDLLFPKSKGSPRAAGTDGSPRAGRPRNAVRTGLVSEEDSPFEPEPAPVPAPDRRELPARPVVVAEARRIAEAIAADLDRPVRLRVTDNSSTMVSYRRLSSRLEVRVHHMFLSAPDEVVRAIGDYAGRGEREAGEIIDRYVRANTLRIRPCDPRRVLGNLNPEGRVWNLAEIYERINAEHFQGRIDATIGWGRAAATRRRRTIRMGVYDHLARAIRIHPALDRREVPRFFVDFIVFHEMLHQALPGKQTGGRRQHHGPDFRARERAYPDYQRAIAWERENLGLLLGRKAPRRAARAG